jgi:hypothetical protein
LTLILQLANSAYFPITPKVHDERFIHRTFSEFKKTTAMTPSTTLDSVRTRFINRDSAGMVSGRLDDTTLGLLAAWYCAPQGGGLGNRIVTRSPIVDTLICARCWAPDVANQRDSVLRQFVRGLAFGDYACGDRSQSVSLDVLCGALASHSPLLSWYDGDAGSGIHDPLKIANDLLRLDPSLDLALLAILRLGQALGRGRRPHVGADHAARLLFLAGALGAGVSLQIPNPQCGAALFSPNNISLN